MIIDLETEKQGLDESQLAERVMRLLVPGWQSDCNGPWRSWHDGASFCLKCDEIFDVREGHRRVPKPLREVRDDLIKWMGKSVVNIEIRYAANKHLATRHSLTLDPGIGAVDVYFNSVADEPLALALAAIRLLGEKES